VTMGVTIDGASQSKGPSQRKPVDMGAVTTVTTVTVVRMNCSLLLKGMARPSRELGGGVMGREHKSDKA
jgi:hypothetical protein